MIRIEDHYCDCCGADITDQQVWVNGTAFCEDCLDCTTRCAP